MEPQNPTHGSEGGITKILFWVATTFGTLFVALIIGVYLSDPAYNKGLVMGMWAAYAILPTYAILSITLTFMSLSSAKRIQASFWLHHTHILIIMSFVLTGYIVGKFF